MRAQFDSVKTLATEDFVALQGCGGRSVRTCSDRALNAHANKKHGDHRIPPTGHGWRRRPALIRCRARRVLAPLCWQRRRENLAQVAWQEVLFKAIDQPSITAWQFKFTGQRHRVYSLSALWAFNSS